MTDNSQAAHKPHFGREEGEQCWRNGCTGIICVAASENCSCHINPPCGSCTEDRNYCPVCDWHGKDDHGTINDMAVTYGPGTHGILGDAPILVWKPRPLDTRKLDYRNLSHTHFSMIKEGVYPPEMTRAEVEEKVRGTFGGRFKHFGDGKFSYVAYTD